MKPRRGDPAWTGILVWSLCAMLAAGTEQAQRKSVNYFVSYEEDPGAQYGVMMTWLRDKSPAKLAGVQRGDILVAEDGLQVRSINEFLYINNLYPTKPSVDVTVLRDGEVIAIEIPDPKPGRDIDFYARDHGPDFLDVLESWEIDIEALFDDDLSHLKLPPEKNAPHESTTHIAMHQPVLGLTSFPMRGKDAIATLSKNRQNSDREWVKGLLRVYIYLLNEQPEKAAMIINDQQLSDRNPDSFLSELLAFYIAVIEHPVTMDGVPLGKYGVGPDFFATCYPYPIYPRLDKKDHEVSSFESDPKFQREFHKALSGVDAYQSELSSITRERLNPEASVHLAYVEDVKRSILNREAHGGWPHRSSSVSRRDPRRQTLPALVDHFHKSESDRIIIAMAILAPSLMERDFDLFSEAYGEIKQASFKELACANRIIEDTCRARHIRDKDTLRIQKLHNPTADLPLVYQYLQSINPELKERIAMGSVMRSGNLIRDLSFFSSSRAWYTGIPLDALSGE